MNIALDDVLAEYEARQADEDLLIARLPPEEVGRRRDELSVAVGRSTGTLLHLLVRESRARSILELGTSLGYSTLWLADAARMTGGQVMTVDRVPSKQDHAAAALRRAGLHNFVSFHVGDALEYLMATGAMFDFVLLDLWKDLYIPCIDALIGRLSPGALVVADNMLQPVMVRLAGARYQAHVRGIPELQTVLLPVGSGLAVSRFQPTALPRRAMGERVTTC